MSETTQDVPLLERYKIQSFLTQDVDQETYDQQPIDNYGIKMLENMGWYEERGVGKQANNCLMKIIEPQARIPRQGLGADPKPIFRNKYQQKQYEQQQKAILGKKGLLFQKDDKVFVINGKHKGLYGLILSTNEQYKEAYLQLNISEQVIKISYNDLKKSELIKKTKSRSRSKEQKKNLTWIQPNIKVRIIQKKSKHYNTKVVINDIIDYQTFSVVTPQNQILDDLKEKDLETVIPSTGQKIIFVTGEYKNEIGIMQGKDKKKQIALVQLEETLQIVQASLNEICELFIN